MNTADTSSRLNAAFSQALIATLGQVTGKTFSAVPPSSGSPLAVRELTAWQQEVTHTDGRAVSGMLCLATGADFSRAVGTMMVESAPVNNRSADQIKEAWHQVAGKILGRLIASLNSELGCDLTLISGMEAPHNPALEWTEIGIQGPGTVYRVLFSWPAALAELFTPALAQSPSLAAGSGTFDLLLDVALPVAVSFGRTALQIREVLKLSSGSIIELNRLVSEPVDVVVNDSIIARGEVVVVDGNYGVRITQIASREERIRTGIAGAASLPSGVAA